MLISIEQLMTDLQLMNFRTYLEFDVNYKRFSAEMINLLITIYLIFQVFLYCLTSNFSWILTISLISFLSIYSYTNFIRLISILPNLIMFLISSIRLSKYISYGYLFLITISMLYFILLYPLFYLLLRRLTIQFSNQIGLKLARIRERIHETCLPSFFQYQSSNIHLQLTLVLLHFFVLFSLIVFF